MAISKVNKMVADILRSPTYISSPDAGHGEAGIVISPDPIGGGFIVYSDTDTYNPEDGTGTYRMLIDLEGNISLNDASLEIENGGHISLGTPPPTSATTGTGIWIDETGIYGLSASTQEVVFSAATGKIVAGAGEVTLDRTGLIFDGSTGSYATSLKWYDAGNNWNNTVIYGLSDATDVSVSWTTNSKSSGGHSSILVGVHNNPSVGVRLYISSDGTLGEKFAGFGTPTGVKIAGSTSLSDITTAPLSLLHLKSTAPTFRMEDSTGSALSWLQSLDANVMTFETTAGTDLMTFNLSTLAVHIPGDLTVGDDITATDDITADDMFVSSASGNHGFSSTYTGASAAGTGPQNSFTTNDGSALADNDRLGALLFNGFDGGANRLSAAIIVQAEGAWANGTARGSRISFFQTASGSTTLNTPFVFRDGSLTLGDAVNIVVNTSTGTKFGTATTQKIGFFNATPVVQPGATTDLGTVLSDLGLRASGTAYPITTSGTTTFTGTMNITDVNIVLGTTTGTKIGTATTQKLGFFNATPIVQPSAYTQTYSTADKTLAADGVTDPAAYGAGANGYSTAAMAQAVHAAVIALHTSVNDTKQMLNSLIDDLQALGLIA